MTLVGAEGHDPCKLASEFVAKERVPLSVLKLEALIVSANNRRGLSLKFDRRLAPAPAGQFRLGPDS